MSDLTQTGFDYGDLPVEKVLECETAFQTACAIEDQATRMIGEQFAKVKENLRFLRNGNGWRDWCDKKLTICHTQAQNYINEFENGGFVKNFYKFGKSARWLLVAPNTPQEVRDRADALVEAGEDVSVKTIKKLKSDYESERLRREAAEKALHENSVETVAARFKLTELETQIDLLKREEKLEPVIVEKAPDDYESTKQAAAQLREQLASLKKKQAELVQQQVTAKLREREKELADLDRQAKDAESRLQSLNKQIDSYSSIERMTRLQRDQIEKSRSMLAELAANMEGFDPLENDPKTDQLWDALADMLRNGAIAIDLFRGRITTTHSALALEGEFLEAA